MLQDETELVFHRDSASLARGNGGREWEFIDVWKSRDFLFLICAKGGRGDGNVPFLIFAFFPSFIVNKHKPWIETTYHGIVTENDNTVLLDPPLIALDKDAPLRFAGTREALLLIC